MSGVSTVSAVAAESSGTAASSRCSQTLFLRPAGEGTGWQVVTLPPLLLWQQLLACCRDADCMIPMLVASRLAG